MLIIYIIIFLIIFDFLANTIGIWKRKAGIAILDL